MTEQEILDSARSSYGRHAQQFWEKLEAKGPKAANAESEAAGAIARYWNEKGELLDLLYPLLSDHDAAVRYAAAAALLKHALSSTEAIRVLREVAMNGEGFLGAAARLFLMKEKIPVS